MTTIRHMEAADAKAVSKLISQAWEQTYSPIMGADKAKEITSDWHSPKKLGDDAKNEELISFVAEDEGAIIGHAMAGMDETGHPWIHRLYVVPERFGSGLSADLLHAILAAHSGLPYIDLEVLEGNDRAIRFYEKHGFETLDITDCCGIEDAPARIMRKMLPLG